ncbi:HDOD domain-containing protein [Paraglaciecola sp.]|uniref:EAL and HDOD domain-containing protein n=1 Tax=Paraglaciecola sp. TaxID=1920173 RepID=UPI0030F43CAE
MDDTILLARQPIFDGNNKMVASEILYRGDVLLSSKADRNIIATRELLINTCTNILNDNINLDLPMLLNIDEQFLLADDFFPVAPQNLIFEILETVEPTELVLDRLKKLKRQGFEFALDDYLLETFKTPFFEYLKIIKIDVIDVDFALLKITLPSLKQTGCLLLAEKVETQAVYKTCRELGFDLFQGYYLEKPTLIQGKKIDVNQRSALHLVSQLSRHDIEVNEVAELISRDPVLTVKILALINCPLYQLVREVKSVKDAVIILGLNVVKQWGMILTLVSQTKQPLELFRTILIRAKTLALYAECSQDKLLKSDVSECFLVGLLSGVDAIFEIKLENILEHLMLDERIKIALLGHDNKMGQLLKNSMAIERFDNQIFEQLSNQEICLINRCYRESLKWADQVMNNLQD